MKYLVNVFLAGAVLALPTLTKATGADGTGYEVIAAYDR
jgi:hypothetical protein